MKCPHCAVHFYENWQQQPFCRGGIKDALFDGPPEAPKSQWAYQTAQCPKCNEVTIEITRVLGGTPLEDWRQVHPIGSSRGPVSKKVPANIVKDYDEACSVLTISARASAALARSCLQKMLRAHSYKARTLALEIDMLLNALNKGLSTKLLQTIAEIKHFDNFSTHPTDDETTLQVIDVESHEANWCLEIIEELFDHFYEEPAQAKARTEALNAKLMAAG
ncbi:protein of unknown function [Methylocapsa palsarum]|uniref:DUF4145 domain-containing protein n=2 Tax=Methylocapsa palsarum TaxID=1612308 RepID=A0A1I4AU82_9HYPH|nr:protein of unknown function [Methylocapsa palsarum]